jgi:hypothetical protein
MPNLVTSKRLSPFASTSRRQSLGLGGTAKRSQIEPGQPPTLYSVIPPDVQAIQRPSAEADERTDREDRYSDPGSRAKTLTNTSSIAATSNGVAVCANSWLVIAVFRCSKEMLR